MNKQILKNQLIEYKVNKAKLQMLNFKKLEVPQDLKNNVIPIDIALKTLTCDEYDLLKRRYFENQTIDDVSYELAIGTTTVSRRVSNILNKMLSIININ